MRQKDLKYIGASVLRNDGLEKVTGQMKYTGDLRREGMLYASLLTSDRAHAKVLAIDTAAALAMPGVVRVYTADDVPPVLYSAHNWLMDMQDISDEPLLTRTVRHHGDRIAFVLAETEETARAAVGRLKVTYEDLPVMCSAEAAMAEDALPIHPYGNTAFDVTKAYGDTEAAFKRADLIVEDTVRTPGQHHAAIENHVCLAYMEDGVLTVKTPCQITFQVQMMLSRITGLPHSKVRIMKTVTGGSFGGKSQPVLEPLCGYLAYDLGRPVLMTLTREQSILSSRRRNSVKGTARLAVSSEGKILARELDIITDTGAYFSNGTAVTMAMMKKSVRLYRMEGQHYRGRAVITNTPVGGAARGYGSPQIHAVTEINIENAARDLGMDPLAFRLKNIVSSEDKDPMGGPSLGNVQIEACLKQGAALFGWEEKYRRPSDTGRYRKGVGMSAIVHGNGYFGGYPEFTTIELKLMADGSILANTALHDLGCGTMTVSAQIIAEGLGVALERVTVLEADTLRSPYDPAGTQACRVTYVCGEGARLAAEALREKIIEKAAVFVGTAPETLHIAGDAVCHADGAPAIDLAVLSARSYRETGESLSVTYRHDADGNPGSYAANFAEVTVDTWTGFVEVNRIVAAHDIGKALNPEFVKGQIYGGVQMNLGYALCEEMPVGKDGRVKSLGFSKYHVVNAPSMPQVDIVLIEEGEPGGPYGAKSIGESSSVATAPAIINAINHALGTRISELPATPERILAAL